MVQFRNQYITANEEKMGEEYIFSKVHLSIVLGILFGIAQHNDGTPSTNEALHDVRGI